MTTSISRFTVLNANVTGARNGGLIMAGPQHWSSVRLREGENEQG